MTRSAELNPTGMVPGRNWSRVAGRGAVDDCVELGVAIQLQARRRSGNRHEPLERRVERLVADPCHALAVAREAAVLRGGSDRRRGRLGASTRGCCRRRLQGGNLLAESGDLRLHATFDLVDTLA